MAFSALRRFAPAARVVAAPPVQATSARAFMSEIDTYGKNLFKGEVADTYLAKQGLPKGTLEDPTWTSKHADKVAAAVMEWGKDQGASVYTHWFQVSEHGMQLRKKRYWLSFQNNCGWCISFDDDEWFRADRCVLARL